MNNKNFNKNKALRKELMPQGRKLLKSVYDLPIAERPVLTHHWLAAQLSIPKGLAYPLLVMLATHGHYCKAYPSGQIYWDDAVLTEEQAAASLVPRELAQSIVTHVLADAKVRSVLRSMKIPVTGDLGEMVLSHDDKIQATGYCLRISTNKSKYKSLLDKLGELWVSDSPMNANWTRLVAKTE